MITKDRSIKFRCTQDEYEELDKERRQCNMNMSNYVRDKLFREGNRIILNPDLIKTIQQVTYEINKIGVNINQVVAACNSKGFTSMKDIEELRKQLALVELRESRIIKLLLGELTHGNNKTASDKGDKRGK